MAEKNEITTYNLHVKGISTRLWRFMFEMYKSQSSGGSATSSFDQIRLASYLQAIRVYRGWVQDQVALDLPETHPSIETVQLLPQEDINSIENESLRDVVGLLQRSIRELCNSQSSRQSTGLNVYDDARLMAVIEHCQNLLDNYIAVVTPLDLPESSPTYPVSGPGKTGV